ncbi:hypothetical protein CRG98_047318 [Punica granatum]|uniref:Reverse transcriptase Ty1/copia-type domain-containing protein n=1 Tax=Punica granatum TaxID=22663 RepID=A0A2I0HLD8_PUNGR|nr:hypothetical protein CRG98_047318 [Punica granatum]
MGEEDYVLGIKILRDRSRRHLGMFQENYIKKILEQFQMHNCKPCDTPIAKGENLSLSICPMTIKKEQHMSRVRYAIATVKRILHYLRGTMDYELCYRGNEICSIGYSDADWAGDVDERKSTTGYAFLLNGGTVSWVSKEQTYIALSTMEAKLGIDDRYFGMLPKTMIDSARWGTTGKVVGLELSDTRVKDVIIQPNLGSPNYKYKAAIEGREETSRDAVFADPTYYLPPNLLDTMDIIRIRMALLPRAGGTRRSPRTMKL